MYKALIATTFSICIFSWSQNAAASEDTCFINNSNESFTFLWPEMAEISLPPNAGDQNKCFQNDSTDKTYQLFVNGKNLEDYYRDGELGFQALDPVAETTAVGQNPDQFEFQLSWDGQMIGERTYYFSVRKHDLQNPGQDVWRESMAIYTNTVAVNWSKGGDGVYRIVAQNKPADWPDPKTINQ